MEDSEDSDSNPYPGASKLLEDAQEALQTGDEERALERLTLAHSAVLNSRVAELDMNDPLREALEAAIERDELSEVLPVGGETVPDEWTVDGLDFDDLPVYLQRETDDIDSDTLLRITAEPSSRTGDYQLRFEKLPFEQK